MVVVELEERQELRSMAEQVLMVEQVRKVQEGRMVVVVQMGQLVRQLHGYFLQLRMQRYQT